MGVPHFRGGLLIGINSEGRTSRCFSGAMEEHKKKAIENGGPYRDTAALLPSGGFGKKLGFQSLRRGIGYCFRLN